MLFSDSKWLPVNSERFSDPTSYQYVQVKIKKKQFGTSFDFQQLVCVSACQDKDELRASYEQRNIGKQLGRTVFEAGIFFLAN